MHRRHLPFRLSKVGAVLETLKSLYESSCNGMTLRGIKTVDEPNICFEIDDYGYKKGRDSSPLFATFCPNFGFCLKSTCNGCNLAIYCRRSCAIHELPLVARLRSLILESINQSIQTCPDQFRPQIMKEARFPQPFLVGKGQGRPPLFSGPYHFGLSFVFVVRRISLFLYTMKLLLKLQTLSITACGSAFYGRRERCRKWALKIFQCRNYDKQ